MLAPSWHLLAPKSGNLVPASCHLFGASILPKVPAGASLGASILTINPLILRGFC